MWKLVVKLYSDDVYIFYNNVLKMMALIITGNIQIRRNSKVAHSNSFPSVCFIISANWYLDITYPYVYWFPIYDWPLIITLPGTVLKISNICQARDLWNLARSCKHFRLLCTSEPWNLPCTALFSGFQSSRGALKSIEDLQTSEMTVKFRRNLYSRPVNIFPLYTCLVSRIQNWRCSVFPHWNCVPRKIQISHCHYFFLYCSPPVYRARNLLAALDFHMHADRALKTREDGTVMYVLHILKKLLFIFVTRLCFKITKDWTFNFWKLR